MRSYVNGELKTDTLEIKEVDRKPILVSRKLGKIENLNIPGFSMCEWNICLYGGLLKWWYPTTIGFPTKNDHFGVF